MMALRESSHCEEPSGDEAISLFERSIVSSAITDFRRAWLIKTSSDLLHKFKRAGFLTESGSFSFQRVLLSALFQLEFSIISIEFFTIHGSRHDIQKYKQSF